MRLSKQNVDIEPVGYWVSDKKGIIAGNQIVLCKGVIQNSIL